MSNDIVLGLVFLLLSIPTSIISALLTPKILDWWARRSRQSAEQKISKLGKKVEWLNRINENDKLLFTSLLMRIVLIAASIIPAIIGALCVVIAVVEYYSTEYKSHTG